MPEETPVIPEITPEKTNWIAFALILFFILVVIGLVGVLVVNSQKTTVPVQESKTVEVKQGGEVKITKDGFEPEVIRVKVGSQVTWVNKDSSLHKVAADPYPSHTLLPGLVSTELSKNQTYQFTFTKAGVFTYHDHMNPLIIKGSVIVESK